MIAVALFAPLLLVVIPVARSLIWLYNAPKSIGNVHCSLNPWSDKFRRPILAGQTFGLYYPYFCEMGSWIPPWLPYKVRVEVRVIDGSMGDYSTGTVLETHQNTHTLMNGIGSWGRARNELEFDFKPNRPGPYIIRYETHVTDVFGRSGRVECNTAGFTAR